jgi:hypothetical protein
MAEENFNVKAEYDLSRLDQQEATDIQPRLRRINEQIQQTERNMEQVVRKSFSAISATVSVARMMASSLGDAFPPIFDAILTAITQTIYSLQSMAAAYAAGVVTAPLTAVLEMAAISLSIAAIGYTAMGQQQVAQDMQRVQNALSGMGRMGRHYGGVYDKWQNT